MGTAQLPSGWGPAQAGVPGEIQHHRLRGTIISLSVHRAHGRVHTSISLSLDREASNQIAQQVLPLLGVGGLRCSASLHVVLRLWNHGIRLVEDVEPLTVNLLSNIPEDTTAPVVALH